MADTYEKDLAQKSSLTTSDFIRIVGSDNVSYKQQLSNVMNAMRITPYTDITTLGTADLNTWRLSGIYIQNVAANVTTELHYPVARTIGFLEVIAYTTDTERVLQRYTTIPSCDVYERIRNYDGTWYSWVKQPTRAEVDALKAKYTDVTATTTATGAFSIPSSLQSKPIIDVYPTSGTAVALRRDASYFMVRNASDMSAIASTSITLRIWYLDV